MICTRLRSFTPAIAAALTLTVLAQASARAQSLAGVARPPAPAQSGPPARGFVWKAERDGRQLWLVGSLHLLTPDFYPLPDSIEQAFTKSNVLMEEIDMSDASDPQFAAVVLSKAMNPPGVTLASQLSKETIALVTAWLAKLGIPFDSLQAMKPWMVSVTVQTVGLQRLGFDPEFGIDKHFADAAKRANKQLVPLETALEQINFLDGLSPKTQDLMLRQSVESNETEQAEIKTIAAAWRAGDAAAMERVALSDMKDSREVYETLLAGRNRRWIPKLEACSQANQSCFVVVGAAHLVGPDGLLALLKQRGFNVTQQ
jgi:uncharacterized protein YbaP (TraB family)